MNQTSITPPIFTVMDNAAFGHSPNPALAFALYLRSSECQGARELLGYILDDDQFCIRVGDIEYSVSKEEFREALDANDEMNCP